MHLDIKRRSTSPTANGRTPPAFLRNVVRAAPQKKGTTSSATLPKQSELTNLQRDCKKEEPKRGGHLKASNK